METRPDTPAAPEYHERQRLQQCLRHTLNNLFQRLAFRSADLDAIANQLAPGRPPIWHPHRTLLLGNYDVNVLEVALRRHGKELHWCDLRDSSFQQLDLDACMGLILNVQGDGVVSRVLGGRHWLALGRVAGRWWNLDSSLEAPQLIAPSCDDGGSSGGNGMPADSPSAAAAPCQGEAGGAGDGGSGGQAAPLAEAAAGTAAGDATAVRRFLAQQVQQRDAKVFRVVECALASHPLPPDDLAVSRDA